MNLHDDFLEAMFLTDSKLVERGLFHLEKNDVSD
jgi:hypothetical protein